MFVTPGDLGTAQATFAFARSVGSGLKPGQKVEALQYLDRVEFIPVRPLKAMRGFLKGIDTTVPRDRDRVRFLGFAVSVE